MFRPLPPAASSLPFPLPSLLPPLPHAAMTHEWEDDADRPKRRQDD